MKGILLAGGNGTRLSPITLNTSKQLVGVYDKPVFYYPLSTLLLAGCKEIAVISTPRDIESIKATIELGGDLGVEFHFLIQDHPRGIPDAYLVAKEFLNGQSSLMVLGDNFFHGNLFGQSLQSIGNEKGAICFAYKVRDPSNFAVLDFGPGDEVKGIEEKPDKPKSNFAIPGIYYFDGRVSDLASRIVPSERGELEIVDLLNAYLKIEELEVRKVSRGTAWLDMGTPSGLLETAEYVRLLQARQGLIVGSPHEATVWAGNVSVVDMLESVSHQKSEYFALLQKSLYEI
jgi:glucose-1-phosphate thymidylyltransferase